MKVFQEMVTLVTKQSLNKIEVFDEELELDSNSLYLQLYKGIADGSIKTDEDAAQLIYKSSPKSKKYQMLKSRLKERLTNTLFFLNHKKKSESLYLQTIFQCNKNYFCSKILLTQGARTSAVSMAKSTLSLAEKFDLNDIIFLTSKMLRNHFALMGKKKEQNIFNGKVSNSIGKLKAEDRSEYMYETLVAQYASSKANRPELASMAKKYFEQSKEVAKHYNSFHLYLLYYRIGILYYQIIDNYLLLLKLCNRFQSYLRKNERFYVASREGEIALLKMACYHHLNDFKNGKSEAENAVKYYASGRNNWFTLMENYFLFSMHSLEFDIARRIIDEVEANKRFEYLSPEKTEAWKIYNAYINYVAPISTKPSAFRIMKFLNEVPIYSKDKEGYYPAILIAQILFLIDDWNETQLEKNIESLRVFSTRHLSGKNAPRTVIFIKMLRQLFNNNYDLKKVNRKTKLLLEKLKSGHGNRKLEVDNMEIILYDRLWEILIDRLTKKRQNDVRLRKS